MTDVASTAATAVVASMPAAEGPAVTNSASEGVSTPPPAQEETKSTPRESARFAELAKRQRELTQKQLEIKAKEERLTPVEQALAKAKENPLAALEVLGISYEDLTHYILQEGKEPGPEDKLAALEKRIEEKERAEREAREREAQERVEATLAQFKETIAQTAKAAPEQYELINASGQYGVDLVFETVSEYFESNKQVLPLETALQAVEAYLEGEALKVAQANKIKAKLVPPATAKEKESKAERQSQAVTLTNKLVSSAAEAKSKRLSDEESKRAAAALLRWN